MERQKVLKDIYSFSVITIIYFVGIIGHSAVVTLPWMIKLTPLTLLLTGSLVLYSLRWNRNLNLFYWCCGVFIVTFLLEITGVHSGFIFGKYSYGDSLGLKFLNVPLIIGFNWMFVLLGAVKMSGRLSSHILLRGLYSFILAVMFDLALEPVAVKLSYWYWQGGTIPIQNYAAWGFFAFFSSIAFDKLKINANYTWLPEKYFLIQFIFFLLLNLFI